MAATTGFTFATTVWMINRIHNDTTIGWPNPHPACASGFADTQVLVVQVANLAYGRNTVHQHTTGFTRWQLE